MLSNLNTVDNQLFIYSNNKQNDNNKSFDNDTTSQSKLFKIMSKRSCSVLNIQAFDIFIPNRWPIIFSQRYIQSYMRSILKFT